MLYRDFKSLNKHQKVEIIFSTTDQKLLFTVALKDADPDIRHTAKKYLSEERLESYERERSMERTLATILPIFNLNQKNKMLQESEDELELKKIALEDSDIFIRKKAVRKIANQKC